MFVLRQGAGVTQILSHWQHHTLPLPSISTPLPPATARLCVCLCERWLELCKVSYWSSTVASRPLKIITVAHLHLERRRGMRAPASVASSHILLNVFHFNHPRFLCFFFFLISPIPFSSQVHLAFIQKFNSALERLGLYLKPYRWINRAEIL